MFIKKALSLILICNMLLSASLGIAANTAAEESFSDMHSIRDWNAHSFQMSSGNSIMTRVESDGNGGVTAYGYQSNYDGGEVGMTYLNPLDLESGFSFTFSLEGFRKNGVDGVDSWFAVALSDKALITDAYNEDPFSRHPVQMGDPTYGSAFILLIRPCADNTLTVAEYHWNGVTFSDGSPMTGEPSLGTGWYGTGGGTCATVQVFSFENLKLTFHPTSGGGTKLILNDGDYTVISGDEKGANGELNPNNDFPAIRKFFSATHPAYLSLSYRSNAYTPNARFTVHTVNKEDAAQNVPYAVSGAYELLPDVDYRYGLRFMNRDSSAETPYYVDFCGTADKYASWRVAQWNAAEDLRDPTQTTETNSGAGIYSYANRSNEVTIDQNNRTVTLRCNASTCYGDTPRKYGEPWAHLLLENNIRNAGAYPTQCSYMNALRVTFDAQLTEFIDLMNGQADTDLHAAQFLMYLYITSVAEDGTTEFLWFGIPIFDNRSADIGGSYSVDSGVSTASGLLIYTIPRASAVEDLMTVDSVNGDWYSFDVDILPYVKRAISVAHTQGFMKTSTLDNISVTGINFGWEVPGTYDVEMSVRDLSITSYIGDAYPENPAASVVYGEDEAHERETRVDDALSFSFSSENMLVRSTNTVALRWSDVDFPENVTLPDQNEAYQAYQFRACLNESAVSYYIFSEPVSVHYKANDDRKLKFYLQDSDGSVRPLSFSYSESDNSYSVSLTGTGTLLITTYSGKTVPLPKDGSNYVLDRENGRVYIPAGCSVSNVSDAFDLAVTVTKAQKNAPYVGTGSTVENEYVTYTVIVLGDVNATGRYDSNDGALIRAAILQRVIAPTDQNRLIAADLNGNGRIDTNDYILFRRLFLKLS